MSDFEQLMIGAITQVYSLTPQKGILFHMSKSIYRRVKELGLSHQYLIDAVFRTNIKMIPALVFWCLLLTQYKCLISNHAGGEEQAGLDYSEINYIGEVQPGKCLQPRPPRALP